MRNKYYRFYPEYITLLSKVNVFERWKLLKTFNDYAVERKLPEKLKPKSQMIFNSVKPIIDGDIEYQMLCDERKSYGKKGAGKRWKNSNYSKK